MSTNEIVASFKVIIIGNSGVGKTSLLQRFLYNTFNENMFATLGMNTTNKEITLKNGQTIILKLFDTAGQERFRSLSRAFFRNVDCVLFVYGANDIKSFENISDWIRIFLENHNGRKDIPLYLIENKNDLERSVEQKSIDEFLKEYKFRFKSVSAKLNEGNSINDLFLELSEILGNNYKEPQSGQKRVTIKDYKAKKVNKYDCRSCVKL